MARIAAAVKQKATCIIKNKTRRLIQKFALQTSLLTAHSQCNENVRKKVKSEVETSSLTFYRRKYEKRK